MSQIKATIIIPTFNSAETIEKCLASIRANVTRYGYEIIVVDARSNDSTVRIAGKYADRVLDGVPFTINREKGVAAARGDIICFTDSDCLVPEDWIDKLVGGLLRLNSKDDRIVGVGSGNVPWAENSSSVEQAISKTMRSPLVSFRARNVTLYKGERQVSHNPPVNSALFRWAIEELGGFNEEPGYPEDLDLDIRINERGYKLYYLPTPIVQHKHKTDAKKFARQMYYFGRKRIKVNRKHPHASRFYHYGPLFLFLMLYSPLFFIPLAMALANSIYVSVKEKSFRLLGATFRFSISFYYNYGAGEAAVLFKDRR